MRSLLFPTLLLAFGCEKAPARIVVGIADTVVINANRPTALPIRVLDRAGRIVADTAVRYQWKSGAPISITDKGIVACTESVDATVRASIGSLATDALIRCRPVRNVRATRMLNLIVGGQAQDLPFEAIGMDGQPVTLMSGQVSIEDSAIVSVEGFRIRALSAGESGVTMRVGNHTAYTNVQTYALSRSPEGLHPGQRVAVPVRLMNGELQRWRLDPSPQFYFIAMLPDGNEEFMPRLAIVGANCGQGLGPHSFFCLARREASVMAYYPQNIHSREKLSGNLVVWRQEWIQ